MHMFMHANGYEVIMFEKHEATHFTRLQTWFELKLGQDGWLAGWLDAPAVVAAAADAVAAAAEKTGCSWN